MIPDWLTNFIIAKIGKKFFGKITIEFIGGEVVLIRSEETHKPPKA